MMKAKVSDTDQGLECFKSGERGVCGKCGCSYTPYIMFMPDDESEFRAVKRMEEKYGWFCQGCFKEEYPESEIGFEEDIRF